MKRKILVVDDEELARARLLKLLQSHESAAEFELREAQNGLDAMACITESKPDIVFLDMEMPEMSGIDMLYHLPDRNFLVIFQTAFSTFAVQAFEHSAVDFLLKPYTKERFTEALDKALKRIQSNERLGRLEDEFIRKRNYLRRFVVKVGSRTRIIDESEIYYFSSEDHVTEIHIEGISYAYQYSLTFIEERVDPEKFLRVHKNRIVALDATVAYTKTRPMLLTLKTGEKVRVAREREKKVRDILQSKNRL